jgi:hypothetical protein
MLTGDVSLAHQNNPCLEIWLITLQYILLYRKEKGKEFE